ncbi:MAG TPA: hypothetical protein VFJ00_01950 [Candidatus Limnocylindria bacterium]|nr:hypothetical protein [Candidatus Limnocylindria bacterium]
MRRSILTAIVLVTGLVVLLDLMVVNPSLDAAAGAVNELLVLLAAAAAVGGGATLVAHHARSLAAGDGDSIGSIALLLGMAAILVAGLRPGSSGTADPAVLWLVAALLAPIAASVFALLFIFLLGAFRRGFALRVRETTLMAGAATVVIILLLPVGGQAGDWLAASAGWVRDVPLAGVFRGLLIGIGILVAVSAARSLLAMDGDDE